MTPDDVNPLHTLRPTTRFSARATDYVRYRPDYPAAAIDYVLEGLTDPTAADVGAGTGIAARALAERGVQVIAIEPNAAMRNAAAPHAQVRWIGATGESTGLADSSVDLVISAQAFHWFDQARAIDEFRSVLRPGGRLALVWNKRSHTDPLTRGYIDATREAEGEHATETPTFDPGVIDRGGRFEPTTPWRIEHTQRLDREGLRGRAASDSTVPRAGDAFDRLTDRLDALWARHRDAEGLVTFRYTTEVWRTTRR